MMIRLKRDLTLPLAKKGCTFGVELETTGGDGKKVYFVHYYDRAADQRAVSGQAQAGIRRHARRRARRRHPCGSKINTNQRQYYAVRFL